MEAVRRQPFELTLATSAPENIRTGVLVVGAFADGSLPPAAQRVDAVSNGGLAAVLKLGDLGANAGATLLLHHLRGIAAGRVLLVSLGSREQFGDKTFRDAIDGAARALAAGAAKDAAVTLADIDLPGRSRPWRLQHASRLIADGAYRFSAPRAAIPAPNEPPRGARRVVLLIGGPASTEDEHALRRGRAIAEGMAFARDLGNLPGNVCNPPFLAETARALGREFGFEVEVLERDDMKELGMGAALAVGRASEQPCRFIVMHYASGGGARPVVLIGKGVTFDTFGAASVFGAMKTVARLRLPINIVGIVPAVENMPGGNATRTRDIVTSMSGRTIEILDADVENLLALADALTYAERFDPDCVIDVATATGACVLALGHVASGLFANDDALANELLQSGIDSGDRSWRLPMFDEYQDQLRSNFADIRTLGGRPAGPITAACFLGRFAAGYKWAHLDIGGTNTVTGDAKGASGRPVPLLVEYLIRRDNLSAGHRARQPGRTRRRVETPVARA
jgi:leucyl aminopeptidase